VQLEEKCTVDRPSLAASLTVQLATQQLVGQQTESGLETVALIKQMQQMVGSTAKGVQSNLAKFRQDLKVDKEDKFHSQEVAQHCYQAVQQCLEQKTVEQRDFRANFGKLYAGQQQLGKQLKQVKQQTHKLTEQLSQQQVEEKAIIKGGNQFDNEQSVSLNS
jgi:hypothetical protein